MVEPTESEDLAELDRFCDAMIAIRARNREVAVGSLGGGGQPAARSAAHRGGAGVDWERAYDRADGGLPGGPRRRPSTGRRWPGSTRPTATATSLCNVPAPGGLRGLRP